MCLYLNTLIASKNIYCLFKFLYLLLKGLLLHSLLLFFPKTGNWIDLRRRKRKRKKIKRKVFRRTEESTKNIKTSHLPPPPPLPLPPPLLPPARL